MSHRLATPPRLVATALCCAMSVSAVAGAAAVEQKRSYNLPSGDAATTLNQFAGASGQQIVFMMQKVKGERTNAVAGDYAARDALDRMLAGTGLSATRDPATGAFVVSRKRTANAAPRTGEVGPVSDPQPRPKTNAMTSKPRTLLAVLLGLVLGPNPATLAADAPSGTVEGRVFNAVTGSALANAKVVVDGSAQIAITDQSGSYRFSTVVAGPVIVAVSYLGMQPQSAALNVPAGGTAVRDFELFLGRADQQVVKLDAFSVVESREMSAQSLAMNEQRHAPNLKNVVAMDEFGDRGQENIGDFLTMLPGVSIVLSGLEPFEVSLRGLPSGASGLMIDGAAVASTRDERSPNLRAVPMANLSRVEVTKVPTPDVPANGLGGTINLISKAGFDSKRPAFSYQLYGLFHSSNGLTLKAGPRHHIPQNTYEWKQPSFDFNYTHPVNSSFSVTVGGARTWRMVPMVPDNDENATWNMIDGIQRSSQITSLVQLNKTLSGQIGLDWRLGKSDTLSLSYHQRRYELPITRSTMIVNYGTGVTGNADFSQGAATGVGSVSQGANWRVEGYSTEQLSARYRHNGKVWRFDANASWSASGNFENDIEEGTFRNVNSISSNLIIRGEGMPKLDGIMHRRFSAVTRTGAAVDVYDGGFYSIPSATSSQVRRKAGVENIRLDTARDFTALVPLAVKMGVAANRTSSDLRTYAKTWDFRPNGSTDVNARMAKNFDVFDESFLGASGIVFGKPYRELSLRKLYELSQRQPSWFVLNQSLEHQNSVTGSREYTETISAAYLRTDVRLFNSRLWLVGGVRFERTAGEGRGPLDDINVQYQRDPAGNFVLNAAGQRILITNDALALSKLRYQARAAYSSRSYSDFYPSLNATFNLSEKLLVRAAYARTIGRPNVNFITPGVTITAPEVASPTITVSNTGLLPWTADNYDVSFESYNFKDGVGSVGFFQKNISNFFGTRRFAVTPALLALYSVTDDGSFGQYQIATRENVGDARIRGIELGYRQSLTFLPQWARGLQVFVNYTKLNLGGSSAAEFTGFNPETMAAGINFVRGRYLIKSTYSYQGEARREAAGVSAANGVPPDTYTYQAKQTRWNINGEYTISRGISVFCSVMDIGGFNFRTLRYGPNTPDYAKGLRIMRMGSFTTLGVKGRF